MKSFLLLRVLVLMASSRSLHAVTPEPEVAELSFDTRLVDAELAKGIEVPSGIVTVRQVGGVWVFWASLDAGRWMQHNRRARGSSRSRWIDHES